MLEPVTTAHPSDEPWDRFYTWGPSTLLVVAGIVSAATATLVMTPAEYVPASASVVAAVCWEGWWLRYGGAAGPTARAVYFTVRTAVAFALSWFNPFFAIYASMGYFDAHQLLPERWARAGILATALTLAGSQSGGLPPKSPVMWVGFGALFVINASIATVMFRMGERDQVLAEERIDSIAELERTNRRLAQALSENKALHAQLVLRAREAGIDDERRRLAAEIHDTLAQDLTGIVTQLQASQDAVDPLVARRHVDRAQALARRSLGGARRSVQNLAPQALEQSSLGDALAQVVATWSAEFGVRAEFTVTGTVVPLHDELGATLLRITQEALTNVGKHAAAARVGVTVSYMDDEVSVDVRDDGCGFDAAADPAGGFGLRGMQSRAARMGGAVNIETEPGGGTAVSVRVPLEREEAAS